MGLRALGARSQILVGALEEAERRNTLDHFTIAQARRLSTALDIDLTELSLSEMLRTRLPRQTHAWKIISQTVRSCFC